MMAMPSGRAIIFLRPDSGDRGTGAITESIFMFISTVGHTAVGMPSGEGTALLLTKRNAGAVAESVFMCESAVS